MGIHFADHLSDFLVTEEEIKAKASTKAKVNEEAKAKGKVNVQQMEKANVQKMEEICKLLLVNFTPNEITEGLERAKSSKGKTPWDYKDMKDRKERDKKEGGVFGLDYDMEEKHLVIQEMPVDLKKVTTPDPRDIWFQCGVCEKLVRSTMWRIHFKNGGDQYCKHHEEWVNARLKLSSTRKGSEFGDPVKYEPQTDRGSGAQLLKQDKAATATTPPKKRKWRTMQTARKRESKPAADPGSET